MTRKSSWLDNWNVFRSWKLQMLLHFLLENDWNDCWSVKWLIIAALLSRFSFCSLPLPSSSQPLFIMLTFYSNCPLSSATFCVNLSPLLSLLLDLSFLVWPLSTLSLFFSLLFTSPCQSSPFAFPSHPQSLFCLCSFIWHLSALGSSPSGQHGSSKPPLSSSAMTSRILLRQQLMREQLQEQERREQQRQQASQYPQITVAQTPAINVSVPVTLPPAAQVPMEVLKVRNSTHGLWRRGNMAACMIIRMSGLLQFMYKVSTSEIRSWMCHWCSQNSSGGDVFIDFIDSCVDSQAIVVLLWLCVKNTGVSEVC